MHFKVSHPHPPVSCNLLISHPSDRDATEQFKLFVESLETFYVRKFSVLSTGGGGGGLALLKPTFFHLRFRMNLFIDK
jgi:hypothetical protein